MLNCFFFQAEDGIRDLYVTGVQTCALPIFAALTTACLGSGGGALAWSYQEATSAASTSGWNCTPRTLPNRNAWLGAWPPQASRSAPGGRSKTSWCEENTSTSESSAPSTGSARPLRVKASGIQPYSGPRGEG